MAITIVLKGQEDDKDGGDNEDVEEESDAEEYSNAEEALEYRTMSCE